MKIGFIGAGNLATALAVGSSQSDFFCKNEFFAYDVYQPSLDNISGYGVKSLSSVTELIEICEMIILAVKPKDFPKLLQDNSQYFMSKDPFVVSVAAGTELAYIRSLLGYEARLARIMPNINARVKGSATAVCVTESVTDNEKHTLIDFCSSFGGVFEITEDMFAVFGVIGGCSPAFNYMYIDQLARAAVKLGMPKSMALDIAAQAVKGSADMILESESHPYELIDKVCSPGGTTIEGVTALQENGFENAVNAAVVAAYNKDCKMREKK
ncbi:MAG: pyrroline-5-carboxylate reductase [Clostridia bacterium]|nr:pyrroline-5-carboxylate reductase [Clostridia bacterium]